MLMGGGRAISDEGTMGLVFLNPRSIVQSEGHETGEGELINYKYTF